MAAPRSVLGAALIWMMLAAPAARAGSADAAAALCDRAARDEWFTPEFRDLVGRIDRRTWKPRAAAAAHVGLGRVLLEHFNQPYEAREHLLKARVEFYAPDRDADEIMAAACYWLGMTAEKLAAQGEAGAKLEAGRYYQEVLDQYKTTSWVEQAKQGMNRVR